MPIKQPPCRVNLMRRFDCILVLVLISCGHENDSRCASPPLAMWLRIWHSIRRRMAPRLNQFMYFRLGRKRYLCLSRGTQKWIVSILEQTLSSSSQSYSRCVILTQVVSVGDDEGEVNCSGILLVQGLVQVFFLRAPETLEFRVCCPVRFYRGAIILSD